MTPRRIDQFLSTLASELGCPARLYLTGAAAAALLGRVRPSLDVDFGLELRGRRPVPWQVVEGAVERASKRTGIAASAAEDIDRWGMITLLDYKKRARRHRRFGLLDVRVLDPLHWSIGKLTRFLDVDIRDVVEVFRRQAVMAAAAARLWGRALRASPASTAQFQFRRQVEAFLRSQGRRIWGAAFDVDAATRVFHRAARIPEAAPEPGTQLETARTRPRRRRPA